MEWFSAIAAIGTPLRIYATSDFSIGGKIERSSGTRPVNLEEIDYFRYEKQARVPQKPWMSLTDAEKEQLLTDAQGIESSLTICLMKASGTLLHLAESICRQRANNHRGVPSNSDTSQDHADCTTELRKLCTIGGELAFLGLQIDQPGLETVTLSDDTSRLPGLHVDSWDNADIQSRTNARNRLSINVGSTPRYFLFIPLSLQDIASFVKAITGKLIRTRGDQTPLGREFMQLNPMIPVVRCRIDPGELYIAPTENIVHDGSSADTNELGRSFAVLGRFLPN